MPAADRSDAADCLTTCITRIRDSMACKRLKLNEEKTQIIWLGTRQQRDKVTVQMLKLPDTTVLFSFIVSDLDILLDSQLTMASLLSSRMHVINHNWSAMKQRLRLQSVAEISRHSVLSGDRIRQCETSSGSRHKDTVAISFCRHRSVLVPCENGSAETTVAEGG